MLVNEDDDEAKRLEQCLPKAAFMGIEHYHLVNHKIIGFLVTTSSRVFLSFKHFCARNTDFIISNLLKRSTTWLKSLLFAIVNSDNHPASQSPLLTHNPHDLVYSLENGYIQDHNNQIHNYLCPSQLDDLSSPRLLSTHLPYTCLPKSIKTSECRILFIARNPLDVFVSQWHFYTKLGKMLVGEDMKPYSIEDYFEDCMEGKIMYGPFFEHVVEYWKQSLERSDKVLFLKYEDLKDDPTLHLKRMADFIGMPFSLEEENACVIKEITKLCDIKSMKKLDVNKEGISYMDLETNDFFSKGEVRDWTNYFTAPMNERLHKYM